MKKMLLVWQQLQSCQPWFLVILSSGANIYAGGEYMQNAMFPHDISHKERVNGQQIDPKSWQSFIKNELIND